MTRNGRQRCDIGSTKGALCGQGKTASRVWLPSALVAFDIHNARASRSQCPRSQGSDQVNPRASPAR